MSSPTKLGERNRWMGWQPKALITADTAESQPTKPSKLGSVGFVGGNSSESPKIHRELGAAQSLRAFALLNQAGIRIMQREGVIKPAWR